MRAELRAVAVALVAAGGIGLAGCTDIEDGMARVPILNFMREAPSFDPYEAPRPAPPNAVPTASPGEKWEPPVEQTEVALRAWGDTLTNPLPMEQDVILEGAEVFATYCSVCHGVGAQGDGPIVAPGKFPLATNLTLPTTVNRTDGYIYAIVRVGRGLMPAYQRIPPSRRWAVVNYVRYLQQGGDPIRVELPGVVQPGVDGLNTAPPQGGAAAGSAGVLVLLGLIGFIAGLAADADRAWRAYIYNWIFFAGIAQGAVLLAAVVSLTRGVWSRPVRRVAVSFVAFLPIAYLILFPPVLIWGADHILPWLHEDVGGKAAYLNMPFLAARHIVSLAVLLVLSVLFAYWQLRPDAGLARDAGWAGFGRLTKGWQSQELEEERAQRKLVKLAPALALVYAVAWSLVAFDFVMSLDPHWLSTLIGPYVFMAAFLGGIGATAILTVFYRGRLSLAEYIEGANLHDLAKLFFAFSVFWAYLFWSQYIVIWYGNLPNEQSFLVNRLQDPYRVLAIVIFVLMFVTPFFGLLGVKPKKTPLLFASVAGLSLLGLWLERYILVYPTLYPTVDALVFGLTEVAVALMMLGLLVAALAWFGSRFPMLQVWQPATEVELLGVEVEEPTRRP